MNVNRIREGGIVKNQVRAAVQECQPGEGRVEEEQGSRIETEE